MSGDAQGEEWDWEQLWHMFQKSQEEKTICDQRKHFNAFFEPNLVRRSASDVHDHP